MSVYYTTCQYTTLHVSILQCMSVYYRDDGQYPGIESGVGEALPTASGVGRTVD